jgi:translation initiation factor 2 alpha subunit (eIF-2alpha)
MSKRKQQMKEPPAAYAVPGMLPGIEASARRMFPNRNLDRVMVDLLLERAQKNLIKYQTMARDFEQKYGKDFESFRQAVARTEAIFEVEQDYFDWEMAVTGAADMAEEIDQLKTLSQAA